MTEFLMNKPPCVECSPWADEKIWPYVSGLCYRLALDIHDATGWDLVAYTTRFSEGSTPPEKLGIDHAMVRTPSGLLLDAFGLSDEKERIDHGTRPIMQTQFGPRTGYFAVTFPVTRDRLHIYMEKASRGRMSALNITDKQIRKDTAQLLEWALRVMPEADMEQEIAPQAGMRP